MLNIEPVALDIIKLLRPTIRKMRVSDRNLADQLDRSTTSVVLNLAEGSAASGPTRRHCSSIALREARESVAALRVADAKGLARTGEVDARFDHVIPATVSFISRISRITSP